jgi:hypothetical protein
MSWISVRNWRKFQHYDPAKRAPKWIKVYAELMSDDAFLQLTLPQRGILVSIWLEYASARCALRGETASLSRRIGGRVTSAQLKALTDAGFIDIVASKTLADGYQDASPEVEVEVEEEKNPSLPTSTYNGEPHELPDLQHILRDMPL